MASQQGNSDDLIAELAQLIAKEGSEFNAGRTDPLPMPNSPKREPVVFAGQRSQGRPGEQVERGGEGGPTFIRIPGMSEPIANPRTEARGAAVEKVEPPVAKQEGRADTEPAEEPQAASAPEPQSPPAPAAESPVSPPDVRKEAVGAPESALGSDALAFLRVGPAAPAPAKPDRPEAEAVNTEADSGEADAPQAQERPKVEPAKPAGPTLSTLQQPPLADDFHFDFGLTSGRPQTDASEEAAAPEPAERASEPPAAPMAAIPPESHARSVETVVGNEHDAIAELIAAELEAAQREQARQARTEAQQHAAALPVPSRPPLPPGLAAKPEPDGDKFATRPVFGLPARPVAPPPPPTVNLDPMDEIEQLIGAAMRNEARAPGAEAEPSGEAVSRPAPAPRVTPTIARAERPAPQAERAAAPPPGPSAQPEKPQARPAPVVPPLGKFAGPRRAALREVEPAPLTPDETVLAAMNASGEAVGRADLGQEPEPAVRRRVAAQRPRRRGGVWLMGTAAALVVLIAAGGATYYMLDLNRPQGPVPVLTADASPVKKPAPPADPSPSEETRAQVMAQIDGKPAPKADEQLVSRDQSAGTDVASIAADNSEGGLANRKVRTVTVRPDGTIVSNSEGVAGNEVLPVSRPSVPAVPGAAAPASTPAAPAPVKTAETSPLASPAPQIPQTPIELARDQVAGLSDHTSLTDAPPDHTADVAETASPTADSPAPPASASDAPVPMPRLMDRPSEPMGPVDVATAGAAPAAGGNGNAAAPSSPVNAVVGDNNGALDLMGGNDGAAQRTAAATPPAATPAPSTSGRQASLPPPPKAGAYVQVASQRSMADATASMNVVLNRFGDLFSGATPEIVKADLGAKGTYYRVRIPVASLEEASRVCSSIKAGGGDCFPTRN